MGIILNIYALVEGERPSRACSPLSPEKSDDRMRSRLSELAKTPNFTPLSFVALTIHHFFSFSAYITGQYGPCCFGKDFKRFIFECKYNITLRKPYRAVEVDFQNYQ